MLSFFFLLAVVHTRATCHMKPHHQVACHKSRSWRNKIFIAEKTNRSYFVQFFIIWLGYLGDWGYCIQRNSSHSCRLTSIVTELHSSRKWWAVYVARKGRRQMHTKFLWTKSGHLKPNPTWENSIKMDAAEVVWGEGCSWLPNLYAKQETKRESRQAGPSPLAYSSTLKLEEICSSKRSG
jgi:hypothetical protein